MSTVKTNNILDASGGNTATINSMTPTADSLQGFRNRLINSDMRIDQRNAGASVTMSNSLIYPVDRWASFEDTDGVMTAQQDSSAPTGFKNSVKCTTTTADGSLSATQRVLFLQRIEGFNVADLAWGTASAKTVTLSFWVRSSITGTFGGSLGNVSNRSYPFTYSISVADTWEQKTVTIAGETSGTWGATTGTGIQVCFGLGVGSTYSGTAGAWSNSDLNSATGATSVIGTLNATWYITGVQLEVGSTATPFERRPYGTELALCQRYYYKLLSGGNVFSIFGSGWAVSTTAAGVITPFKVSMRTRPTALEQSGTASDYVVGYTNTSATCSSVPTYYGGTNSDVGITTFTVASGLTAGQGIAGYSASGNSSAYLAWSAEL